MTRTVQGTRSLCIAAVVLVTGSMAGCGDNGSAAAAQPSGALSSAAVFPINRVPGMGAISSSSTSGSKGGIQGGTTATPPGTTPPSRTPPGTVTPPVTV